MLILAYFFGKKEIKVGTFEVKKGKEKDSYVLLENGIEIISIQFSGNNLTHFKFNLPKNENPIFSLFINHIKWFKHLQIQFNDTWKIVKDDLSISIDDDILEVDWEKFNAI